MTFPKFYRDISGKMMGRRYVSTDYTQQKIKDIDTIEFIGNISWIRQ